MNENEEAKRRHEESKQREEQAKLHREAELRKALEDKQRREGQAGEIRKGHPGSERPDEDD
ncbi:hypothetical protein J7E50_12115 [Pedobacter sp. ISL-68]|uniref:hypothetical protein n=1 Tax=unclassified Pedobacter TaxID=2628915 RepID=UPI001BE8BEFF|nr:MULTISPECIES: hypothetical protein [unclassified Pedobacter]MBT2561580.1 hypothetical protein [Pedobacter sp. ISL-64]MBT2590969.1 hypothetical protein [Pedobacter sp. ISL-68]